MHICLVVLAESSAENYGHSKYIRPIYNTLRMGADLIFKRFILALNEIHVMLPYILLVHGAMGCCRKINK
jgi:hypothetical protein